MESITINLGSKERPFELDIDYTGMFVSLDDIGVLDATNLGIKKVTTMNGEELVFEDLTTKFQDAIIDELCGVLENE